MDATPLPIARPQLLPDTAKRRNLFFQCCMGALLIQTVYGYYVDLSFLIVVSRISQLVRRTLVAGLLACVEMGVF